MESIAVELKAEREKQSISLAQIAGKTNISIHYLRSIEDGRFSDLPGGMYNRAFLRAYCEVLDLDQAEMLQRYDDVVAQDREKPARQKSPVKTPATSLRTSPVIIWSLILLVSIAGAFFGRNWIAAAFSPYLSDTSASRQDHPKPAPQNTDSAGAPVPLGPVFPESSTLQEVVMSTNGQSPPNSVYIDDQIVSDTSPAVAAASLVLNLEITGKELCWISIKPDENRELTGMIAPGEIRSFNASERMDIIVGNAGGISMKINGQPAKPLGNSGEVIRLTITEKSLPDILQGTAG
jgi:cytoskeleton protein RodZ